MIVLPTILPNTGVEEAGPAADPVADRVADRVDGLAGGLVEDPVEDTENPVEAEIRGATLRVAEQNPPAREKAPVKTEIYLRSLFDYNKLNGLAFFGSEDIQTLIQTRNFRYLRVFHFHHYLTHQVINGS